MQNSAKIRRSFEQFSLVYGITTVHAEVCVGGIPKTLVEIQEGDEY
jgi:hypothetical protein